MNLPKYKRKAPAKKELVGVDLFVHWTGLDANELAEQASKLNHGQLFLSMITNRGIKVWPNGFKETFCTDHWRCRFKATNGMVLNNTHVVELLKSALDHNIDVIKTENLYAFDGVQAFSLGQGQ